MEEPPPPVPQCLVMTRERLVASPTMDGLKSFMPFYLVLSMYYTFLYMYFVQESTCNSNFEWFALLTDTAQFTVRELNISPVFTKFVCLFKDWLRSLFCYF